VGQTAVGREGGREGGGSLNMVFLPFRRLGNRGAAVAVVVCVVLSGALYKLEEVEKSNPERFDKGYEVPWRNKAP
jgi:hypothetical protein